MSKVSGNDSSVEDSEGSYFSDNASSDDEHDYRHRRKDSSTTILWTFTGNDAILYDISDCISHIWREIGRHLLKRETLIENIDTDYDHLGEKEKAYQLLVAWHRMMGTNANVQHLQNVLEHIGEKEIADILPSLYKKCMDLQQQRGAIGSKRRKSEIEGHLKLQKEALRSLKQGVKFYKNQMKEIEELKNKILEHNEARMFSEQLHLKDFGGIKNELDSLHTQVYNMQENTQQMEELDEELRYVAEKLYAVEQTVNEYCDKINDVQIAYYSECRVGRFARISCLFGSLKRPKGSTKEKRKSMQVEEIPDDVFTLPEFRVKSPNQNNCHKRSAYLQHHKKCEDVQRNSEVSSLDIETSVELQEFITCNTQKQCDDTQKNYMDNLPDPCYESSEAIFSLLTKSSKRSPPANLRHSSRQTENICFVSYIV